MAWNIGYEEINIDNHVFEGQWEVDADSEESAKNPDLIPYLLIGRLEWADVPYKQIEWVSSNKLGYQESIYTGENSKDDEPIVILLGPYQVQKLIDIMDKLSEGVSLADFQSHHGVEQ